MADQATLNMKSPMAEETPARAVARNTGEFLHDLVTLAELQTRLLIVDGQEGVRNLTLAALAMAGGLAVALAVLPVLLIALGLTLVELAGLSPAVAMAIAGLVGIFAAGALVLAGCLAWRRQCRGTFDRSVREWKQTSRWIKEALKGARGDASRKRLDSPTDYTHN